jgi:hypothetical protein
VTPEVHDALAATHVFEKRCIIDVKDAGAMPTWFSEGAIIGIRPVPADRSE